MKLVQAGRVLPVVLAALALSACSTSTPTSSLQTSQVDISQSDVTALSVTQIDGPTQLRVIALANGSAEIVNALGLQLLLVGRDVASTESALSSIPVVTSGHQVIPEKILALRPDVVLIDSSTGPTSALDALAKNKIRLIMIPDAWTLNDIAKKVSAIGAAIGAPRTARALNLKMQSAIGKARTNTQFSPRVAFLYLRGTSSIYLMGGPGSGADSLISAVGAQDVGAASLPHPFNSLTSEALVSTDPDILLVMTKGLASVGGVKGLIALPGVAQTSAGKHRRVISVDDSLLLSFGPRTPDLLTILSAEMIRVMKS